MFGRIFTLAMLSIGFASGAWANESSLHGEYLSRFLHTTDSNCHVSYESSGIYHQMYVNGKFKGNYRIGSQDSELEYMLHRYVANGVCSLPDHGDGGGDSDGEHGSLIGRFMMGGSSNCYVGYDSSYTYRQMWVNGDFKGNYRVGSEDARLEFMLRRYVSQRVCHLY